MNRNHEIGNNRGARDEAVADELALLIDGATNYAIYMLDRQGIVTIWNRGAERIKIKGSQFARQSSASRRKTSKRAATVSCSDQVVSRFLRISASAPPAGLSGKPFFASGSLRRFTASDVPTSP